MPKNKLAKVIKSKLYLLAVLCFALYALIADDFRIALTSESKDVVFFIFTSITLGFFVFDQLLWLAYKEDKYFWNSFFFFDGISNIVLIFDLGWIYNNLFSSGTSVYTSLSLATKISIQQWSAISYFTVIRYVRLIRLSTIFKYLEVMASHYYQEEDKKKEYYQDIEQYKPITQTYEFERRAKTDINKLLITDKNFAIYPSFDFDNDLDVEIETKLAKKHTLIITNTSR